MAGRGGHCFGRITALSWFRSLLTDCCFVHAAPRCGWQSGSACVRQQSQQRDHDGHGDYDRENNSSYEARLLLHAQSSSPSDYAERRECIFPLTRLHPYRNILSVTEFNRDKWDCSG